MEIKLYTDERLVELVKTENSSDALEELVNRHSGLFTSIVKKYIPAMTNQSGISYADVLDNKKFVIYSAVTDYEPTKGQFNTWLGNKTRYFCLNSMSSMGKRVTFVNNEEGNAFIDKIYFSCPEENFNEEAKMIFDILEKHPDKRLAKIFYMRFYLPKPLCTFKRIAKKMKLSHQGVINLYNKAKTYLQNHDTLKKTCYNAKNKI